MHILHPSTLPEPWLTSAKLCWALERAFICMVWPLEVSHAAYFTNWFLFQAQTVFKNWSIPTWIFHCLLDIFTEKSHWHLTLLPKKKLVLFVHYLSPWKAQPSICLSRPGNWESNLALPAPHPLRLSWVKFCSFIPFPNLPPHRLFSVLTSLVQAIIITHWFKTTISKV